ncbi:glycosyltransferase [Phycicoccus sp. CSK15P-2]|uniref:glycosyltransferase n=1 Tax=Phycicoccus sp. CSK15P-2 TaxID=2807627 RepID=UPI00194F9AC7|nr:glycosyltransferase [Phycicoccus sp. CSK15P-2]MBM6405965.1 glycosyltransferase [Phycicoccus sp. CSK15P-2]
MRVSVVVVGYGHQPTLETCLAALRRDDVDHEVVLVDNGIERPPEVDGVHVVTSPGNLGFAGGAVLGVERSSGEVLVFVNSDAVVARGAVRALVDALEDETIGMVCGCVTLADDPRLVNSVGNPVHVTGISWAGGYGDPVAQHQQPCDVASVSGAFFALRREVWDRLGGLDPSFFMYYEDADLSLRCWLAGLRVCYVPTAVASHAYEFGRNPQKMYLLERNRLTSVLTVFPSSVLRRVVPLVLLTEPLILLVAVRDGWAREKLRASWWVATHGSRLLERRRGMTNSPAAPTALHGVLTTRLTQRHLRPPAGLRLLDTVVTRCWGGTHSVQSPPTSTESTMTADDHETEPRTRGRDYTERLLTSESGWRRRLDVQRPYRWNLRRLELGRCLDIGCGTGRNLVGLDDGSVGVDHNVSSVRVCRDRRLEAYTPEEFAGRPWPPFDSLLMAHVLEHLDTATGDALLEHYLRYLRPGGKIVVITPQERGYASDPTHVRWVGPEDAVAMLTGRGCRPVGSYSFPLPRPAGRFFYANEFVTLARAPV